MHPQPHPGHRPARLDDQQRARILDQAVTHRLVGGGLLVSRTEFEAVVAYRKRRNHVMHLMFTLLTCGMWAIVWIILALSNPGERRWVGTVDEYGQVFWH